MKLVQLEKMWCSEGCGVIKNEFWKPKRGAVQYFLLVRQKGSEQILPF